MAASRIGFGSTKPGGNCCCVATDPPVSANRLATTNARPNLRDIQPPIRKRKYYTLAGLLRGGRRRCRVREPRALHRPLHDTFLRVIAQALREDGAKRRELRVGDGPLVVGLVDRLQLALEH